MNFTPGCYLRPSTPFNEPAIYLDAVRERRVADDVICASPETSTCTTAKKIESRNYESSMREAVSLEHFSLTLI